MTQLTEGQKTSAVLLIEAYGVAEVKGMVDVLGAWSSGG
jgi:hypothetical protein